MVTNPLSKLWIGRATISEYMNVTDQETFQTSQKLVPVVENEPCRVSYGYASYTGGKPVNMIDGAPTISQNITLFIRPDLVVKEGSVIEVTQHGVTTKYKRASVPAVHSQHQEILLELDEDYA